MEIYNEEINDLLVPEHQKLQIHESPEVRILHFSIKSVMNTILNSCSACLLLHLLLFEERHLCCWFERRDCYMP
jgi:hypothetical protein